MKVKECMCQEVCCVKPETNIEEVVNLMQKNHVGCIPVCSNNNDICGIVTDRDILLRCIACNKDHKQTPVSDVMTTNVCTCMQEDEMKMAENKMSQYQVRRLPVCDQNNKVVGILTLGDLAHHDTELGKENVCTTIDQICCDKNPKNAE